MAASSSSVVFLITGASKGLGRAIATVASDYYASGTSRFILAARSSEGLEATKQEILSELMPTNDETVVCRAMDLSDLDRLDDNMDTLLEDMDRLSRHTQTPQGHQRMIFVNNAGSLGHLGPCVTSPSLADMRHTVDLNITSSLWLSVRFARHVSQQKSQQQRATLVNLSSLVAVSDEFVSMGIYSAGKAARERYHTLLAREEQLCNTNFKVLNYAPGPLDTEMVRDIRGAEELDKALKSQFESVRALDPKDSALKLMRLMDRDDWESGAHIDYFDLPDNDEYSEEQ